MKLRKMVNVEVKDEELVVHFRPPQEGIPAEAREHMVNAGKEFLLAMRTLLDAAIETTEKASQEKKKTRAKIKVQ